MALVNPLGKEKKLKPLLLTGAALDAEKKKAAGLKKINIGSRETGDLIMMGIGGFTPLTGFMTKADWKGVCADMKMADGQFWPIPVTVSASKADADSIKDGEEIALFSTEFNEIMATMKVTEKYTIDKAYECQQVYRTTEVEHPGVKMVMDQPEVNLAGPVKVLSEGTFPTEYPGLYQRPAETRKSFEEKGWSRVAAFQTRNPMHRSHEFLAKIAVEVCDGVYIHMLLGKLKPGDIPSDVRQKCIDVLVEKYFVKNTVMVGGYPLDMRYAGPREALLHAVFRQNYGCSHLIVGRDHAGVGEYYGPFDAQQIFEQIPAGSLETKPLKIDWTFYCNACEGMASQKTCPHGKDDRILLSGTKLRKMLSEGETVTTKFSRQEVLDILQAYYAGLTEKVEIKLHKYAEGEKK
jgi:sulfate adenylyltransferase